MAELVLYLIEILHQTTTKSDRNLLIQSCILSKFYIKPQQTLNYIIMTQSCILSKFYIKPQLRRMLVLFLIRCILSKFYIKPQLDRQLQHRSFVVSYRNSTSNHNSGVGVNATMSLYLIEILHQTTTDWLLEDTPACCILSKFYIKPQLCLRAISAPRGLYLIEILHQTTTSMAGETYSS